MNFRNKLQFWAASAPGFSYAAPAPSTVCWYFHRWLQGWFLSPRRDCLDSSAGPWRSADSSTRISPGWQTPTTTSPRARMRRLRGIDRALCGAGAVAIFRSSGSGEERLLASYGTPAIQRLKHNQPLSGVFQFSPSERDKHRVLRVLLDDGVLAIAHAFGHPPSHEDQRLCAVIASACIQSNRAQPIETRPLSRWMHGGEEKALTLGLLNQRLIERNQYIHQALCSVDDGLVIASADGRIAFANPRAAEILRSTSRRWQA